MGQQLITPFVNRLKIVDKTLAVRQLGDCITPAQALLLRRVEQDLSDGLPVRYIILKARQMGFSTMVQGIMFTMAFLRDRMQGLVVAHRNDSSEHLLSINRTYWDTWYARQAYTERYAATNKLAWEETGSLLTITTASSLGAARGKTIQFLHGSEVAFWKDPDTLMTGLNQSVPRKPLTFQFLESTANGVGNWFHRTWKAAVAGDVEYRPLFYPWWLHPEYRGSEIGRAADLSRPLVFFDDDERLLFRFLKKKRLSDVEAHDRLIWRRVILATECMGDLSKLHQEYPSTPEEAFVATGRNVFPVNQLRACYEPMIPDRGELVDRGGRVRFVKNDNGPLAVYRYPSGNTRSGAYLVGGDPAWSTGGDYSCGQVLDRKTWEQCAVYRAKVDAHEMGRQMMLLGRWYNQAVLAPEATKGGGATVEFLRAKEYPNIWMHRKSGRVKGQPDMAYGWITNVQTKHEAIGNLQSVIYDASLPHNRDRGLGIVIHDEHTYTELKEYVVLDNGNFGNSSGVPNDDTVMSLAIAITCTLYEQDTLPARPEQIPGPVTPVEEAMAAQGVTAAAEYVQDGDRILAPATIPQSPWMDVDTDMYEGRW